MREEREKEEEEGEEYSVVVVVVLVTEGKSDGRARLHSMPSFGNPQPRQVFACSRRSAIGPSPLGVSTTEPKAWAF